MAAASIVFKESDSVYSAQLVKEAKALYLFAEKYKGKYTNAIPANTGIK
jgi:endoglucanase